MIRRTSFKLFLNENQIKNRKLSHKTWSKVKTHEENLKLQNKRNFENKNYGVKVKPISSMPGPIPLPIFGNKLLFTKLGKL